MHLKELRKRRGLSQKALAELIGVHENTVWRWENGRATPSVDMAQAIASALGVTEAELLNGPADDRWVLEIKIADSMKEMIDLSGNMPCVASITVNPNGAMLELGGSWNVFRDDAKFADLVEQLRKERARVLKAGEGW